MRKISAIIACVLVLAMSFAMTVTAGPHGVVENPPITVPTGTPTVDGSVTNNEGWSTAALMNAETCGYFWRQNPLTSDGNILFAVDETGFYFAGKIKENLHAVNELTGEEVIDTNYFVYSTGEDWIDVDSADPTSHYGYDGDVFGLLLDPLGGLLSAGFNNDYTPWYLVGLFEGDQAKMYRQKVSVGDITDQVKVAGKKTSDGWEFEAMIPWEIIIKDIEDISYGDVVLTKEELIADGAQYKCAGMYQDRFDDPEAGEVATWGRYITVPTTQLDGTAGHMGKGDVVQSCGITLNISNTLKGPEADDTTATPDDTTTATPGGDDNTSAETETAFVEVTDDKGNVVTDASGNKVTQKVTVKVTSKATTKATAKATTKKATTGTTTGGNAAQTFDIGIAVALGALATSGIGFVATKKRK